MIEDTVKYPAVGPTIDFPKQSRQLRVQVIRDILWYRGSKTEPVMVVLVRDPLGQWRDEALVATDPTATVSDRTTVVYIETDPLAPVPSSQSWWDVPVSETSALESTRKRPAWPTRRPSAASQRLYL